MAKANVLSAALWLAFMTVTYSMPVFAQSRVDLAVEAVQVSTPRLSSNQNVEVTASIRNNGSELVNNVFLMVEILKDGKRFKALKGIPVLSSLPRSGSTQAVPVSMGQMPMGAYDAVVRVDPDNQIEETNESNNERRVSFYVSSPLA